MKVSKLEIIHELYRRGVIAAWYLKPHQKKLYEMIRDTERDIMVPNLSRRFGKTTSCSTYCIEQAISKKQDIRYATAFLSDLQEFIIPIFEDILFSCPDDIRPTYKISKKEYVFKNGSKIKLVGLDKNPNGIRGNAIDILVIDEAAFVSKLEYLYKSIIVPATADRKFKIIFPSTPPPNPDHFWAKVLIPKASARGTYLELTIDDNDSLSDEEKLRLINEVGGINSVTAQREFYCKIVRDHEIIVIPEFDEKRHVKPVKLPPYYLPLTSIDFGGSMDKHGVVSVFYDFLRDKICVRKSRLIDKNTASPTIIEKTLEIEQGIEWKTEEPNRYGDAPGQLRIDLAAAGFYLRMPSKEKGSVEANINGLRIAFLNDEIEIDPDCVDLIETLKWGMWLPNKTDWMRSEELGHLDLLAALLYAFRHIDKSNPYPRLYKLNKDTHYLGNLENDTNEDLLQLLNA